MHTIELEEFIAAPIERVFAMFADFEHAAERVSGIESIEMLTDGPLCVGTSFKETRVMMGRKATETMTVAELDPPTRYVIEAWSCGCQCRTEFRFTPVNGGTSVKMTFTNTPVRFSAKVLFVLMKPILGVMMNACRKAVLNDMRDLKSVLESTPSE